MGRRPTLCATCSGLLRPSIYKSYLTYPIVVGHLDIWNLVIKGGLLISQYGVKRCFMTWFSSKCFVFYSLHFCVFFFNVGTWVISGFRRRLGEIFCGVTQQYCLTLEDGTDRLSRNVCNFQIYTEILCWYMYTFLARYWTVSSTVR